MSEISSNSLDTDSTSENTEILIIDDDELSGQLALTFLSKLYKVEFIKNPDLVNDRVSKHTYRAILLDIDLGRGIRGEDIVRAIRQFAANRDTPVVALTGFTATEERKQILQAGFTHFLPKPYSKSQLISLLLDEVGLLPA